VDHKKIFFDKDKRGQAALVLVFLVLVIGATIVSGFTAIAIREESVRRTSESSKQSYYLAEAGVEDVFGRVISNASYDSSEILSLDGFQTTTTTEQLDPHTLVIKSEANVLQSFRSVQAEVNEGIDDPSFPYAVQVGNGGLRFDGGVWIRHKDAAFSAIVRSLGHTCGGSCTSPEARIDKELELLTGREIAYQTNNTILINGVCTDTPTQWFAPYTPYFPIADDVILWWEQIAQNAATYSGPCIIQGTTGSRTIAGPIVVTCATLEVRAGATLTIGSTTQKGPVWIQGNLVVTGGASIKLHSSYGTPGNPNAEYIITDPLPQGPGTGGTIRFQGSSVNTEGSPGTYPIFISMNNEAENIPPPDDVNCNASTPLAAATRAISVQSSAKSSVLYAPHGKVTISGSNAKVKQVSAYHLHMQNHPNVVYEDGLMNITSVLSPSGGWNITEWKEIQ
jgi:hypothetical protein